MTDTRPRIIVVGTIACTATEQPEDAGLMVWGPYTNEEAGTVKEAIDKIFAQVPVDDQIYGTPYCEIQLLHPLGATPAHMAGNWFREPEDPTPDEQWQVTTPAEVYRSEED